jgi:DNA invertase Pin-like site-specific DNA recombinase
MAVALYVRVSTRRQPQPQTSAPPLRRLQDEVAARPDWPVAAEPLSRDAG